MAVNFQLDGFGFLNRNKCIYCVLMLYPLCSQAYYRRHCSKSVLQILTMVYSIQHYVIKFVSDSRQVGDFLRALRFPTPIKLTAIPLSCYMFISFKSKHNIFSRQFHITLG
jgi:hypothetical protein